MGSLGKNFALRWLTSIAAGLIASLILVGLPAQAADDEAFRYGLESNNQVFLTKKAARSGGSFTLAISGGREAQLSIELVDIFSDSSGAKRVLPLGSSEFSPKALVRFKKSGSAYTPSEEFQYFDIPFRFKKKADLSKPILGGLKISMVTKDSSSNQLRVESSVVGTFAYYPKGEGFGFTPSVTLSEEKLTRTNSDFPPFGLLPDLPFLFNGGDLEVSYKIENTGDIFLEATTEVVVKGPFIFDWGKDARPFKSSGSKAFLVPDQVFLEKIAIETTEVDGKRRSPLGFGFYEVQIKARGSLGTDLLTEDSSSQFILIFPWKFVFIALLLVLFLRRKVVTTVRKSWVQIQNFREFTRGKSEAPVDPEPVRPSPLTAKLIDSSVPKPVPTEVDRQILRPAPPPIHSSRPNQSVPADLMPLYSGWYHPTKPKPTSESKSTNPETREDSGDASGSSD